MKKCTVFSYTRIFKKRLSINRTFSFVGDKITVNYTEFKRFIFHTAIYQKAEALYHLGDFEHSLVFYHRGLHVRPELEQFRLGVQKAREAIENAIGKLW